MTFSSSGNQVGSIRTNSQCSGGLLDHRQAVAAVVVFDLVHDVVDEQDAAADGLKRFSGSSGSGMLLTSKPSPSSSIVNLASACETSAVIRIIFLRVELIAVLDRVYERLIESDKKIRLLGLADAELLDAFHQVFEHDVHER